MTKVVYITGCGRSGSTLLNALLGSIDCAIGVGELAKLPHSGWVNGEYCACGLSVNSCPQWVEIRRAWSRMTGSDVRELARVQAAVERSRYLYRPILGVGRSHIAEYGRLVGAVYDAIAEVSGAKIIVDSSKNPLRALALTRVPCIDLRLIHLVRDVRGVAWSLTKRFEKDTKSGVQQNISGRSSLASMAHWSRVNLFSEIAMAAMHGHSRMRVRYEDLMLRPNGTLHELAEIIDIGVQDVVDEGDRTVPISFGHMVAGNRIRMKPTVSISPDFEWRKIMDDRVQRRLWAVAWPFMRRYDYAM